MLCNRFRPRQKIPLLALLFSAMALLAGCSSVQVEDYAEQTPKLDIFKFFAGTTYAQGQFQNRSGQVLRRFSVQMEGVVDGDKLVLDEHFIYDDGEKQRRIWRITDLGDGNYRGEADDVIGAAVGRSAGNALQWQYVLDLPYKNDTIAVNFNDWMWLQNEQSMFNRAKVSKFGFMVGEVTLFFSKQPLP
ncbi:Lipoprotein [uncultured Thiomicrorhabdus sp.]